MGRANRSKTSRQKLSWNSSSETIQNLEEDPIKIGKMNLMSYKSKIFPLVIFTYEAGFDRYGILNWY